MWRSIAPMLAAVAILLLAHGMLGTHLPLRWLRWGMDSTTISAIAAAHYLGILLGGVYGLCTDGGRTRLHSIVFGAILCGSSAVFLAPAPALLLGAARTAGGFAFAGMNVLIESRLNAGAEPRRRARVLSAYMIIFYLAQATGAALVDSGGAGGAWLVVAAGLFSAATVLYARGPGLVASAAGGRALVLGALLRSAPLGYLDGLGAGILLGSFYGLGPVFASAALARPGRAGLFMAAAMIGGVAALWPIGVAADRLGPARAAPWVHGAVALLALAPIAARGRGDLAVLATSALFGAVAFSLYPIASATINARVGGPDRIAANALLVVASGVGGCVGPLFAAAASRHVGSCALFVTIASSGATIAIVHVYVRWRGNRSGTVECLAVRGRRHSDPLPKAQTEIRRIGADAGRDVIDR